MSSAFDSSWDFLKALNPIPNIPEIENADTPENELRHYNNMQRQKARFATRPPPGPREQMRESMRFDREEEEPARPAMATPRVRPPVEPAGAPPPMSGQEMMESKLLQGLGPLSMGGTGPTRKSVAFARAWGLLKAGTTPEDDWRTMTGPSDWDSSDRGHYHEDPQFFNPIDSPQGHYGHEEPYTEQEIADYNARLDRAIEQHGGPKVAFDHHADQLGMSDEEYFNMILGEGKGPKMHELVDQGAEMELGDIAGMGEEGAEMARHHLERGPAAGQSRAQPPMDAPPAPPQMPPRGQRTLDEF